MNRMLAAIAISIPLALVGCGGEDGGDGDGDGDGDAGTGAAPTASFTFDPNCTNSSLDEITFTSTSTDPDGDTLTCDWFFSQATNNQTSTDCVVTGVTFPNAAPYNCRLTVSDGNGNEDMVTMVIAMCP